MNTHFSDDRDDENAIEIIDLDTLDQDHLGPARVHLTSRLSIGLPFHLRQKTLRLSMFALTLLGCIFLLTALWPAIAFKLPPFLAWRAALPLIPTPLSLTPIPPSQQRYANVVTGNGMAYIFSHAFQNPTHSGSLDAISVENGMHIWSRKNINTLSPPVLIKNVLYLASRDGIDALRASDGSLLWHQNIGQDIICTFNDVLYTNENIGSQAGIYALHVSDGSILWYNPNVTDGRAAGDCTATTKVFLASAITENFTVALNIANGLILWQYKTALTHFSPVNTVTNIASNNEQPATLEGKDPDGTVRWHHDAIKHFWSTDEGDLYIQQFDGSVAALRPNDGSVLWQQSRIDDIQAKDNGILYTFFATTLYLRNANDGSEIQPVGNIGNVGPDHIVVQDGICFIPTVGVLVAVKPGTTVHTFLWHIATDGHIAAVSDGVIYLFTAVQDEPIVALRVSDGKELWHYSILGHSEQSYYTISADANIIYISAFLYGTVTALRSKDGTLLWRYHLPLSFWLPELSS